MKEPEKVIFYEFAEESWPGQIREGLGELYPIFEKKSLLKTNPVTGKVSLDYCGFATSGRRLVTVLPKYLRKQLDVLASRELKERRYAEESGKLYRLLKRNEFGNRNRKNIEVAAADFINENTSGYTNELALAELILSDYQENGLWYYQTKKVLIDAGGETDWELTVNNTDPVISGGSPYYFSTYSAADELVTDSLITQIHRYAVNYCNSRYAFLLDLELPSIPNAADGLEDLGDGPVLSYALEKQLRVTYREREILLLNALLEIVQLGFSRSDDAISLYGRRDFEQVWEAALQYCFGHEGELRRQLFPLPEWFDQVTGRFLAVNVNDTLKPDVLRKISFFGKELLFVLDAKYYLLNYNFKNSFPPVGDIIKQYFYEAAVTRKKHSYSPEEVINAFVFPAHQKLSRWFEASGHAFLDNDLFNMIAAAGNIKKPVVAFTLDPDFVFERYNRYFPLGIDELGHFIAAWQLYLDAPPLRQT